MEDTSNLELSCIHIHISNSTENFRGSPLKIYPNFRSDLTSLKSAIKVSLNGCKAPPPRHSPVQVGAQTTAQGGLSCLCYVNCAHSYCLSPTSALISLKPSAFPGICNHCLLSFAVSLKLSYSRRGPFDTGIVRLTLLGFWIQEVRLGTEDLQF